LLSPELRIELETYSRQRGCSLAEAFRSLAAIGVLTERGQSWATQPDSPASLAALTAAELAVLMVASVLPEGERRMSELAPRAAVAAEERLALFRENER
jgi:hypothetical protein